MMMMITILVMSFTSNIKTFTVGTQHYQRFSLLFQEIGELIKFKLLLDRGTVEYKMCILGSPW